MNVFLFWQYVALLITSWVTDKASVRGTSWVGRTLYLAYAYWVISLMLIVVFVVMYRMTPFLILLSILLGYIIVYHTPIYVKRNYFSWSGCSTLLLICFLILLFSLSETPALSDWLHTGASTEFLNHYLQRQITFFTDIRSWFFSLFVFLLGVGMHRLFDPRTPRVPEEQV